MTVMFEMINGDVIRGVVVTLDRMQSGSHKLEVTTPYGHSSIDAAYLVEPYGVTGYIYDLFSNRVTVTTWVNDDRVLSINLGRHIEDQELRLLRVLGDVTVHNTVVVLHLNDLAYTWE